MRIHWTSAPLRRTATAIAIATLVVGALITVGCNSNRPGREVPDTEETPTPTVTPISSYVRPERIDVPPLPPFDVNQLGLPLGPNSDPALLEYPEGALLLNPRRNDALTAYARCTQRVLNCFQAAPSLQRLEACIVWTPTCRTSQPWTEDACCPQACIDDYENARRQGQDVESAFREAYPPHPNCVPGMDQLDFEE